ncbi:MAG: two-component regulator propeller domain-containing protein [Bacteroidota bacterium]
MKRSQASSKIGKASLSEPIWGCGKKTGSAQHLILKQREQVQSLFVDSKSNIWIGTNNNGLIQMYDSLIIRHFRGASEISHDFVRCVEEDEDGRIWVGTFKGLDAIHPGGKIAHYAHNKSLPTSLSHNSIWSLFRDRDGAMWAGTYFGGVNIFHPTRRIFNYYPENDSENQSINFRVAGQVLEDSRHNLWICTDGGGPDFSLAMQQRHCLG